MARDLEYDISPEAYAVFKSYIELRMERYYQRISSDLGAHGKSKGSDSQVDTSW